MHNILLLISKTYKILRISNMLSISDLIVISAIILAIIIFTPQMIHKHEVYASYAWDLGTFAQALKSTLEGKFMYHTTQLHVLPSGNHMFVHFTPILLLLLPIYAVAPYVTTLLVIKSIVTFAAAYPLYLLSKKLSDNLTALLISSIYLLYPLLHGALWFDFQFSIFLPLFIFLTVYAYVSNRKILYFTSIALLALVSEQGALYAFIISIIHTVPYLLNRTKRFKHYLSWLLINSTNIKFKYILIILVITFTYYLAVANFIEYSVNNYTTKEFREALKAYTNFSILGYKGSILSMPVYAITHPSETFNAFIYEYNSKIIFVVLVYGLLVFLPLQSFYGLFSLPFISAFLLSNFSAYYKIGAHYPYYYLGFIFTGFVIAVTKINSLKSRIRILAGIIIITIFFLINFAPWSPTSIILINEGLVWYPLVPSEKDARMESLDTLIEIVNKEDSSLLVQNHVFTHTTMDSDIYVIPPYDLYALNSTYFNNYIQNLIDKVDLILLDTQNEPLLALVLNYALNDFGVYAEGYNTVLLKRGYNDEPILVNNTCGTMLFHPNAIVNDGVYMLPKGKDGFLVYGPYRFVFNGSYAVTYEIRATNVDNLGAIGMLDISSDLGSNVYSKRIISGYELQDNKWHNITLTFTVNELYKQGIEFRIYSLGSADLEFKGCSINNIDRFATTLGSGDIAFLAKDLKYNVGFKEGNIVRLPKGIKTDTFWYTPKISIVPGTYIAEIYLKLDELLNNENILTIEINYNNKSIIKHIKKNNLVDIGDNWYIAYIPFVIDNITKDLSIIAKDPNYKYDISISHINIKSI
ncbi:MAG: hypothetical protein KatS3mg003_1913 [Candidatus Nitrosocaldaceae archaeon]|nr:MAG: hypothetical protein KatS3mg003_1913 [Candidatus Nitrosocaldaceae archaeon]